MNEIYATVVGNIVGEIGKRRLGDGTELAYFRVASNERRYDKGSGTWVAGETSYVSVTCWRRLARNVAASFVKGDPVVVYGRLYTREYEKEGQARTDLSMEAYAVGPDLTWCTAVVTRTRRDVRPEVGGDDVTAADDAGFEPADRLDDEEPADLLDENVGSRTEGASDGRDHLVDVRPGGAS